MGVLLKKQYAGMGNGYLLWAQRLFPYSGETIGYELRWGEVRILSGTRWLANSLWS